MRLPSIFRRRHDYGVLVKYVTNDGERVLQFWTVRADDRNAARNTVEQHVHEKCPGVRHVTFVDAYRCRPVPTQVYTT